MSLTDTLSSATDAVVAPVADDAEPLTDTLSSARMRWWLR